MGMRERFDHWDLYYRWVDQRMDRAEEQQFYDWFWRTKRMLVSETRTEDLVPRLEELWPEFQKWQVMEALRGRR